MQYRLLDSLGTIDAKKFGVDFEKAEELTKGALIDINEEQAKVIRARHPFLIEPAGKIRAVPDSPLKAPEK
jgi:hypothetical protein